MDQKIDLRRKPTEFKDHWQLRKGFIMTHNNKFPIEKLTTMAQLFVNIETLGVKYHRDVMKDIEKLGNKVPYLTVFRTMKKKRDIEKVHLKELVKLFQSNSISDGDSRVDYRKDRKRNSRKANHLANFVLHNEMEQRSTSHEVSAKETGFNSWRNKRL